MITCCLNERSLPLRRPFRTSQGSIRVRRVLVLVIQDQEGNVGLGEAAPLPAFGGEDPISCREALETAIPRLGDLATRWIVEDRPAGDLGPLEQILRATPCARACVEGALLDLVATRKQIPVAALLAGDGPVSETVPVNAILSGNDEAELAEAASRLVAGGWRCLKVKAGADHLAAARTVTALREWVGDRVALRVDANGAWTRDQAAGFLRATAACRLEFLEQPLPADDLDGLAYLRRLGLAPIAADESVRDAAAVGRIVAKQAADLVIVKPMALGGWRPTQQAVRLARDTGIDAVLTTFLDGSVGRALATHMAATMGHPERAQGLGTGPLLTADLTDAPLPVRSGAVAIPELPGLGIGTLLPELLAEA